ncbi:MULTISPECIES: NUDIX hydrolase [Methylobacterium]|uniref:NUDIX hydrolase n=2 Tax=Pseudomonadota TaxID=1224 RepID=A0ABQ4ST18_9HYPH|nr:MULTISPECIES: NUDIX hydrolase [Methylobacterium]PIU05369.1 MAG: NUDIX hydrolase [Methylobacterium sp. CG09_land_8_20_14_0_10_71_15]PIU12169.1 MAG: NUDIX hydrolase [Methylobacterium sp. CG08_land_8_20_14_0_20_71_15]GBU18167.1 hypothetical protein AwMethylo_23820 [Methylobacterium sp.]GJE06252.1 hypothetical protein AOPFMNJM_1567 [Methylobacterium jeotgali]
MPEPVSGYARTRLSRIHGRLVPHRWAWAEANAAAIAAHWARRRAERPGLFDGIVLLACGCEVADGAATVALFEARFSALLAFRDWGAPDGSVANAFAAIAPVGRCGGVVLGRMGRHTANAGRVYFPCGTPDRADVSGDRVALAESAARELAEETGLSVPEGAPESWVLLRGEGYLAFLRPVRFREDADALVARMERHRLAEAEPELDGFLVARTRSDIDAERMPGFVQDYLGAILKDQG